MQLQSIQYTLNNIELAISFAKLNILHSFIIEPNQLTLVINKLNKLCNLRQIPKF